MDALPLPARAAAAAGAVAAVHASELAAGVRVTASRRRRWGIVGGVDESGIVAKQRWMAWRHSRRTLLQSSRPARRPNSGETRWEGDRLDRRKLRNEREAVR